MKAHATKIQTTRSFLLQEYIKNDLRILCIKKELEDIEHYRMMATLREWFNESFRDDVI